MPSVVVCGKGRLAQSCLHWYADKSNGWTIAGVVNSADSSELTPDAWDHHRSVGEADLLLSVQYDRIFKAEDLAKYKCALNIHYSPLPEYRGMRPVNWALKNGERTHGVTVHEIDTGIDTGNIVAQTTFTICPELDEVDDIYRRCESEGFELFLAVMRWWPHLPSSPQGWSDTVYTKKDIPKLGNRTLPRRVP